MTDDSIPMSSVTNCLERCITPVSNVDNLISSKQCVSGTNIVESSQTNIETTSETNMDAKFTDRAECNSQSKSDDSYDDFYVHSCISNTSLNISDFDEHSLSDDYLSNISFLNIPINPSSSSQIESIQQKNYANESSNQQSSLDRLRCWAINYKISHNKVKKQSSQYYLAVEV